MLQNFFVRDLQIFVLSVDCLLDQAGKACQGQTLQLITKIRKLRTNFFITLGPGPNVIKTFPSVIYNFSY
jgi:hypothetical protein